MEEKEELSEAVVKRLLTALADAYNVVAPESKCDFWQSILNICEVVASGQMNGTMVLTVTFKLPISAQERGVVVQGLRYENVRPALRLEYDDLGKEPEK